MNKKFLIGIIVAVAVIIAAAFLVAGSGSSKAVIEKTQGAKAFFDRSVKNLNDIKYGDKKTVKYLIENKGTKDLEIANIATSCMCTNAYFEKDGKQDGPSFGMKGMTAVSDWKGLLSPGEKGQIVAVFDSAYHGPSGVGPVQRTVSLETNDPDNPYVEFNFEGVVVQ